MYITQPYSSVKRLGFMNEDSDKGCNSNMNRDTDRDRNNCSDNDNGMQYRFIIT